MTKSRAVLAELLMFLFRGVPFCYHSWSVSYSILQDSSLAGCHDVCLRYFYGHSGYRLVNPVLSSALPGTLLLEKGRQMTSHCRLECQAGATAPSQSHSPSSDIRISSERLPMK